MIKSSYGLEDFSLDIERAIEREKEIWRPWQVDTESNRKLDKLTQINCPMLIHHSWVTTFTGADNYNYII